MRWDFAGMMLSGLCAVHCFAMPFVGVCLPLLGLQWLAGSELHFWMLTLGLIFGAVSFLPGYHDHRRAWIPFIAACGLGIIAYAALCNQDQCFAADCCRPKLNEVKGSLPMSLTPAGAALLLTAHVFNCRCRRSRHCQAICCVTRDSEPRA